MKKIQWIKLAEETIPHLPEYICKFRNFNPEMIDAELNSLLKKKDFNMLHLRFSQLWDCLPDSPNIRIYPFSDLCDLCSEFPLESEAADES